MPISHLSNISTGALVDTMQLRLTELANLPDLLPPLFSLAVHSGHPDCSTARREYFALLQYSMALDLRQQQLTTYMVVPEQFDEFSYLDEVFGNYWAQMRLKIFTRDGKLRQHYGFIAQLQGWQLIMDITTNLTAWHVQFKLGKDSFTPEPIPLQD